MGGGLMQLVAYGAQDVYLNRQPSNYFLESDLPSPHQLCSLESIEQTFNGQADFGRRVTCTISRNGDLAYRTYLQVTLPEINQHMLDPQFRVEQAHAAELHANDTKGSTNPSGVYARWLDCPGEQIISQVEVEIGGQRIDRQYGDWMHIWNQLTLSAEQERGYNKMVGRHYPAYLHYRPIFLSRGWPLRLVMPLVRFVLPATLFLRQLFTYPFSSGTAATPVLHFLLSLFSTTKSRLTSTSGLLMSASGL